MIDSKLVLYKLLILHLVTLISSEIIIIIIVKGHHDTSLEQIGRLEGIVYFWRVNYVTFLVSLLKLHVIDFFSAFVANSSDNFLRVVLTN